MYFVHSSVNSLHEILGLHLLCNLKPCLTPAWWKPLLKQPEVLTCSPPPSLFPFSMSYPPDWYYQMHYTAVNSPWKWLGPFSGADVFQPPSRHWLSPKPQSPSSPSPPPSFAPPRVWQQQRGWGAGVEQREEEGDVIEGWNHSFPQGARTSPSPSPVLFNPGDPLGGQGLWHVFEYGLCECEELFHVAWFGVWDYLLDLVLLLIWSQHQTVIFRLGMCCRQAIRPSCPSLALTAVFVCDMQMSPFFFFLLFLGGGKRRV